MTFKSYKDESRKDWSNEFCEDQHPDRESLQFGAILRIADAAETMAKKYQQLIDERDMYKRLYEEGRNSAIRMAHRIAGLKAYITRLK